MALNLSKQFWRDTAERTYSSAVQGFATGAGLQTAGEWVTSIDITLIPWEGALGGAASMAFLTLIKCLYASTRGNPDNASLSVDLK